jgi:hypothetical protein
VRSRRRGVGSEESAVRNRYRGSDARRHPVLRTHADGWSSFPSKLDQVSVRRRVEATVLLSRGAKPNTSSCSLTPTRADLLPAVRRWGYRRWYDPLRDPREGMRRGGVSARIARKESREVSDLISSPLSSPLFLPQHPTRTPRQFLTTDARDLGPLDEVARRGSEECPFSPRGCTRA